MKNEGMTAIAQKQLKPMVLPLLSWYERSARVLPWRREPTPYRVWISEIMLQQTRVEAVKPYFERFISRLPDVASLAGASEEELLKLWEGLGYYSRARNLQKAARILMARYDGELPNSRGELLKLPGIGPYSAGAIASIAYGKAAAAVDGNVLRVLARLAASEEDITALPLKGQAAQKIEEILPFGRCGDFNQALMELGAVVCLPGERPKCEVCPLSFMCSGYQMDVAGSLPIRAPKAARRQEEKTVLVLIRKNRCALQKRQAKGLLAGMWEFPCLPGEIGPDDLKRQLTKWGIEPQHIIKLPRAKHLFTHIEWNMTGFLVECNTAGTDPFIWCGKDELTLQYPLPSAFKTYSRAAVKALSEIERVEPVS